MACGADTADAKLAVMEECGFTVTRDRGGSAGISFLIFKIGGEKKKSDEASNSVTIAFTGTGTAFTPM